MFKKYNGTPAAIAITLVTIFYLINVIWVLVAGENFLADAGIDPAEKPLVNWLGFLFAALTVGFILTFVKGPGGQSIFLNLLLILKIGGPIGSWIEIATDTATASPPSQVALQVVATVVFLFAYSRVRSRL